MTDNMGLSYVISGTAPYVWSESINNNTQIADAHDHSIGSGKELKSSQISVRDGFYAGTSLDNLSYLSFSDSSSVLSRDNLSYSSGGDLYLSSSAGSQVQITSSAALNTPTLSGSSGIGGDYISASAIATYDLSETYTFTDSLSEPSHLKSNYFYGDTLVLTEDYLLTGSAEVTATYDNMEFNLPTGDDPGADPIANRIAMVIFPAVGVHPKHIRLQAQNIDDTYGAVVVVSSSSQDIRTYIKNCSGINYMIGYHIFANFFVSKTFVQSGGFIQDYISVLRFTGTVDGDSISYFPQSMVESNESDAITSLEVSFSEFVAPGSTIVADLVPTSIGQSMTKIDYKSASADVESVESRDCPVFIGYVGSGSISGTYDSYAFPTNNWSNFTTGYPYFYCQYTWELT